MTDRTPLPEQLDVIERMLARAKAEKDWHAIPALKATADLIRWTMANADTLKAAAAVVKHPLASTCQRPGITAYATSLSGEMRAETVGLTVAPGIVCQEIR